MKNHYLSRDFASGIAVVLYESRMTDVLPSLQKIFVEGMRYHEYIPQFVPARQL